MAQTDTARLLTPLGFLGALAVAAGVWFLPLPGPEEPREVVRVGPGPNGSDTSRTQAVGQTPDHDWLALAEPLSKLRDPVEEPTDGGGPPPPPPPPAVLLEIVLSTMTINPVLLIPPALSSATFPVTSTFVKVVVPLLRIPAPSSLPVSLPF